MNNHNFWIPISFANSELSIERLEKAISVCQQVHSWTVDYINGYWLGNLIIPQYQVFRPTLWKFIRKKKLLKDAQRYSLIRASEQTFPYVVEALYVDEKKEVHLAQTEKVDSIQIEARRVWRRYLAKDYGITTTYGTIFPEGDWKRTIREQMEGTPIDLIPFLWHSITVRREENRWEIQFNFHKQNDRFGEKAKKELEKTYG
jgi:hypothetical protein